MGSSSCAASSPLFHDFTLNAFGSTKTSWLRFSFFSSTSWIPHWTQAEQQQTCFTCTSQTFLTKLHKWRVRGRLVDCTASLDAVRMSTNTLELLSTPLSWCSCSWASTPLANSNSLRPWRRSPSGEWVTFFVRVVIVTSTSLPSDRFVRFAVCVSGLITLPWLWPLTRRMYP